MIIPESRMSGYYKRAAGAAKLARFIGIGAFVLFLICCISVWRSYLTMDTVRVVAKYMDLAGSDNTPSNASVTVSARGDAVYHVIGTDLAEVTAAGVTLYDFAGNRLYHYDYTYTTPASVSNGKLMAVYDAAGKGFALYSGVSRVYEETFDYPVRFACLNDMGCFAVVTTEKTYRGGVVVYDRDFRETFRWMSADRYMMAAAINGNASRVACAAFKSDNGGFLTSILVYDTASGELKAEASLIDELPLAIRYTEDGTCLRVLTDGALRLYDAELNEAAAVPYYAAGAVFFRDFGEKFLLVERPTLAGNAMTAKIYGEGLALETTVTSDRKILDAAYENGVLYILTPESLAAYDVSGGEPQLLGEKPLAMQYKAVRADAYGRFILIGGKKASRDATAALAEKS